MGCFQRQRNSTLVEITSLLFYFVRRVVGARRWASPKLRQRSETHPEIRKLMENVCTWRENLDSGDVQQHSREACK